MASSTVRKIGQQLSNCPATAKMRPPFNAKIRKMGEKGVLLLQLGTIEVKDLKDCPKLVIEVSEFNAILR